MLFKQLLCAASLLIYCMTYTSTVYIKNWGSNPITITYLEAIDERKQPIPIVKTIFIAPGNSQHITASFEQTPYTNFKKIDLTYRMHDHEEHETVYFPDQATATTSFYFTDVGYRRFAYDLSKTAERGF